MSARSIHDPAPFQAAAPLPERLKITDLDSLPPRRVIEWLRAQSEQLPPEPLSPERVSPRAESEHAPSEPLYTDKDSLPSRRSISEQASSGRISQHKMEPTTLRSLFEHKTESQLIEFLKTYQLSDEQKKESLVICASLGYSGFLECVLKKNPEHLLDPVTRGDILVATLAGQCDEASQNRILALILPKENYKQAAGYYWWIHNSGVWSAFMKAAEMGLTKQMHFLISKIDMHPVLCGEALHKALENGQVEIVDMLAKIVKKDPTRISQDFLAHALETAREMPDARMYNMLKGIKSPSPESSREKTGVKSAACIVC
jgi:hypothetical protein